MEIESVFITGANRGIGLELVKQLVGRQNPPRFVFATYRTTDARQVLKNIRDGAKDSQVLLIKMDVENLKEVQAARKIVEDMVGDRGLTLLINNAGVLKAQPFPLATTENLQLHFNTNVVGQILVLQEMLPLLTRAAALKGDADSMSISRAAVLNISSAIGSISKTSQYLDPYGYMISKAALNMAMRLAAAHVKDQGILVINMCPGWVKTDMGTDLAPQEVEESVSSILTTISKLDNSFHGTFLDNKGDFIEF